MFTAVTLLTGAIWGKPMWGTWWTWDARLTSFLLLFFLYLGHIALLNAFDDKARGRRSAAVLAVVFVWRILKYPAPKWVQQAPVYVIGCFAAFWFIERTALILMP